MAENIKIITILYGRTFFKNAGVRRPILVRKKERIGNSKINPATRINRRTKLMYSVMLILALIDFVPMLKRKGKTIGIRMP